MASTFVTLPKPFFCTKTHFHASLSKPTLFGNGNAGGGLRRNSLRINAVAKKWEPAKVVPQAERVLTRLEELPEKSAGGVLLPKSAVKFERYLMGEVLSVGAEAGQVEAGKKLDLGTEAGHCFCKASDLLTVVE